MKISFYYVDSEYVKFLKDTEINARGFTRVPNVEYANRKKQLIKKAGVKKQNFREKQSNYLWGCRIGSPFPIPQRPCHFHIDPLGMGLTVN